MARFRLEAGPTPLHHQVYLDLSSALDEGEWQPGDRLPPERELARRYGCSLIPVRRALDELAREGRLERTRGRGTFVLHPRLEVDLATSESFADLMHMHGMDPDTRLVDSSVEPAEDAVAAALALPPAAPIIYLERLRIADGNPLILEQVYLPGERFRGLLNHDLERNSLYNLLVEQFGARFVRAHETIEPILLRPHEARLLNNPPARLALLVEGTAFGPDGEPIEFTRSYIPGGRARLSFERKILRRQWSTGADGAGGDTHPPEGDT
ncbi:GntR family transcriptional regulator [Sinosporangium siamense]|uniref:GntR family transcriptional regulator n=1 Tax=Sinosporangium siamense TaxID=1367973 RepID=A0A919RPJ2_9ACTN|nr:GntR family transcriptional regulator [Sinosporangium siamense]GII97373.1 GntR family transcriptional regulator [Sinosporangium siamense]